MDTLWLISECLDPVSFGRFRGCCFMFYGIPTRKGIKDQIKVKGEELLKKHAAINCLRVASEKGNRYLIDFFIEKGVTDWIGGMAYAARGGHSNLVDFFIEKGATNWDGGMAYAAWGGHKNLVDFFILKGATDWYMGMRFAVKNDHPDLIEFFKQKIENKLRLIYD